MITLSLGNFGSYDLKMRLTMRNDIIVPMNMRSEGAAFSSGGIGVPARKLHTFLILFHSNNVVCSVHLINRLMIKFSA